MQKKPSSLSSPLKMAVSSSVSNMIYLAMFALSMFVIYRYIKSLDNELKHVRKQIDVLKSAEVHNMVKESYKETVEPQVCAMPSPPAQPAVLATEACKSDDCDNESVCSEEILKIIEDIDQEEDDAQDEIVITKSAIHTDSTPPTLPEVGVSASPPVDASSPTTDEEPNTTESLMKKTNEELKAVLKLNGKNIKGTKQELVRRILEEI